MTEPRIRPDWHRLGEPASLGPKTALRAPRVLFLVTEDWYFWSHRLSIARAARDAGYEVHVATRVSEHGDAMRQEGFTVHALPWRRRGDSLLGKARALAAIAGILSRIRPDVLHNVALKPVVFGSVAARWAKVKCCVNAITGLGFAFTDHGLRARMLRRLLRIAFNYFVDRPGNIAVLQNDDDRQVLASGSFLKRSDVVIIRGSGVDTQYFMPLPEPASELMTIAVVARMLAIKGIADIVEASRILRSRGIPHRLLLAGGPDPDNRSSLRREHLEAWASEPGIEWLGHQADVRNVWVEAHIAALASHGGEGLPKTLLEAAACGRPIVATSVAGNREIAHPGVNAILVPPHSPAKLADALAALITNPELRRAYGAASRNIVVEGLSSGYVADETLALYRKVIGV